MNTTSPKFTWVILASVVAACSPSAIAAGFVLKAEPISLAAGPGITWQDDWYPFFNGKLVNLGAGIKPWSEFGVGVEGTVLNGPGQYDMDAYTPSAGVFVFRNASLRRNPRSAVAFLAVDFYPRVGVGVGLNWTLWAVNLETELSWSRVYNNYIALTLRAGLGGWYQFGGG